MNFYKLFFSFIVVNSFYSCNQNSSTEKVSVEKFDSIVDANLPKADSSIQLINIQTVKGNFKVWTQRRGSNPKIKLLLLNGGPGCTHEYFECLEKFLPQENIEFIYYDQLGCGKSDNPNDTALWDLCRYVEEVEQVRQDLKLDKENFFLLGHSWGGIVAIEYALKYQQNLKGLIISNMMCDAVEYGKYAQEVLSKQMKPEILKEIREIEKKKDFSNPRYMELLMPNFYGEHICRIPIAQWPAPMKRSLDAINQSLYVTMQGPSEFGISGKLEKWSRKADMKNITVKTLAVGAKYDTMDPEHMKWISENVKNGTFLYCPNGSHMCFWDDQEIYMKGLINFLNQVPD